MQNELAFELCHEGSLGDETALELAGLLRDEIAAFPGISADLASSGAAPAGSKGLGASLTEVLVALGAAGALLPTIVGAVQAWLTKQPPALSVKLKRGDLEFEMSGATTGAEVSEMLSKLTETK